MKQLSILLSTNSELGGAVIMLVIFLAAFFLLRSVMLWYWKVNESLMQLKQLNANIILLVKAAGQTPYGSNGRPLQGTTEEKK